MKVRAISRLYRRAILIYVGTIVIPAAVLVWLGTHSFEIQRQSLEILRAQSLDSDMKAAELEAAKTALDEGSHPIANHFFTIEDGQVVQPALRSPLPELLPTEFLEAGLLEETRPELALDTYRRLLATHGRKALALAGIARSLWKTGQEEKAQETWRTLAASYPDERDPAHRPYGIVAALYAEHTEGLYDRIVSGRWDLAADAAEPMLEALAPGRDSPYLDRFRFAQELDEQFRPQSARTTGEIYSYNVGSRRIFYRWESPDRLRGFSVNEEWVDTQRGQIEQRLGITGGAGGGAWIYSGAIGLVVVLLSAGVLLLLRDVSREARTNRLRADFVSSVSHELKTPITLIRLYSETLLRHAGLREEERADFNRIIMRESDRLGRLVEQVLTFSRVERGDQIYNLSEGDPAPLVARVVDDYREYLERAGCSLKVEVPEHAPSVRFDPVAVSQALVNLIDNAVKYSGESRDITVRLYSLSEDVAIEVEDGGVGIAGAEQQKIFERFYRIQNGSGKGGYGLGLFLVRHIMEAHNGRAEVDSEPGRGSRFRLVFPAAGT
jgi:signal transduction histidine kinase